MHYSEAHKPNDIFSSSDPLFGSQKNSSIQNVSNTNSATLLVSLFLILIVFFTVIVTNSDLNVSKKNAVLDSVKEKFGKIEDDSIKLGQIIPPKVDNLTRQLSAIFGDDAKIETSIDGSQTIVTLKKTAFFYSDETELRDEKYDKMIKLQHFLKTHESSGKLHVTLLMGLEEYRYDHMRLNNLRNIIGYKNMDIGLNMSDQGNFKTVFENE